MLISKIESMVVIAIAGQPGCGSSTTGKMLAKKLGIEYFSLGTWNKSQVLELRGKRTKTETEDSIAVWKHEKGSSKDFHFSSDMMQKTKAAEGKVVIDAKLSIHMLRGFCDMSVWLKADFEVRAKRVAKRDKIKSRAAHARLREKEGLERENWLRIYGFDYFEQEKEADLVIDVGEKKPAEIVDIILKEIKKRKLA
jgi:predicted cytidylate kinase